MKQNYLEIILKSPEFFGISRFCNICGHRFAKFKLFSKIHPREGQCPLCGSLERHRHLYIYICSIFPRLEGKKILHFAPESFFKKIFMESSAEYFDADILKGRASYQVDITDIPFEDNFFDYIFCIHVLEHIPNDLKAMQELYRVLKPGGIAFLSVPLCKELREDPNIISPIEREKIFGQHDHVRYYNQSTFHKRLKSVNFNIEISDPRKFPTALKDAIFSDVIFLATK